ncbi:UvrB/UvrC motif-containing protein [Oceanobacillus sp. J11TS1]|uniref:UvrB/UvrC motif-containing protein n=1 Tax=Oceanobacillus sp. J11TS1 TaxID=2807191 RepID=UPI001B0FF02D|nr:UvrB/UvrC motif-containing protein [Oceanobacillus sp. J11TS1]GIO22912.1 protein-arginine kinase activator protein [Oceanobacillus sp. J11TS1]
MECQECHKRKATLHFKHIINGQEAKISLCEMCAKKKGYITYPEEGFSLNDLLSGLFQTEGLNLGSTGTAKANQPKHPQEVRCSSCGRTFTEFKKAGKFGCADCYASFGSKVEPILRRVHAGNTKHTGKIPKRAGKYIQQKQLISSHKEKLKKLIEEEEFEKAAVLRDKIRELEKANNHNKEAGGNT